MRLLEEQGIGVYRIGMVGDRASKGQAATVYGAGFAAGSLAGKGARGGRLIFNICICQSVAEV